MDCWVWVKERAFLAITTDACKRGCQLRMLVEARRNVLAWPVVGVTALPSRSERRARKGCAGF